MPRGDAVQTQPTIEEQMAQFKGFSTTDGAVSKGEPTNEEKARIAANAAIAAQSKAAAGKNSAVRDTTEQKAANAAKSGADTEGDEGEAEEVPENETLSQKNVREQAARAKARQSGVDERIGKAVGKQRAAERLLATEREERARERGEFEARLKALENGALTKDGKGGKEATFDPNEPRPVDYEYGELDNKYIRDLARYEARKELLAEQSKTTAKEAKAAQTAEQKALQVKVEAFNAKGVEKYPDFQEVVADTLTLTPNDDDFWPLSQTMGELVLGSDEGRDVAYHLATHPDEAKKVFQLTPAKQAAWFGRMEARFSSESQDAGNDGDGADGTKKTPATAAKETKAPPPPQNRAKGGSSGKTQAAPDTTDFKAFEALAMAAQK